MKQTAKQKYPIGWNEKKVREVIAHYDQQTDEEGAAEIESAAEVEGETWMSIPAELVSAVERLIKQHQRNGSNPTRQRKGRR